MQYGICSECKWTLGIPSKLVGREVSCPKCSKLFLAVAENLSDEKPDPPKKEKKKPKKLGSRAIPLPSAINSDATKTPPVASPVTSSPATSTQPEPLATPISPAAHPPTAQLVEPAPAPPTPTHVDDAETVTNSEFQSTLEGMAPPTKKSRLETPVPPAASPEPVKVETTQTLAPVQPEHTDAAATNGASNQASTQVATTARIIDTLPEENEFAQDGQLPSLQLRDDQKPKPKTEELKTSPVFIGLLICFSLISSAVMLLFIEFDSSPNRAKLNEAREELRKFYETRIDVELEPYQLELRDAQLAFSRNDRDGEIENLRKVLARFRVEGNDERTSLGVTGSTNKDIQLYELLSTLLSNGRSP